jgi:hypothetical protein
VRGILLYHRPGRRRQSRGPTEGARNPWRVGQYAARPPLLEPGAGPVPLASARRRDCRAHGRSQLPAALRPSGGCVLEPGVNAELWYPLSLFFLAFCAFGGWSPCYSSGSAADAAPLQETTRVGSVATRVLALPTESQLLPEDALPGISSVGPLPHHLPGGDVEPVPDVD